MCALVNWFRPKSPYSATPPVAADVVGLAQVVERDHVRQFVTGVIQSDPVSAIATAWSQAGRNHVGGDRLANGVMASGDGQGRVVI